MPGSITDISKDNKDLDISTINAKRTCQIGGL